MILESLRKVVEPLVVASNLTWLVFRSAFDMITDPAQIEECVKDPHAFFAYMLKQVCELSISHLPYLLSTPFRFPRLSLMQNIELEGLADSCRTGVQKTTGRSGV